MANIYRITYETSNGPQASQAVYVSATSQQNAHDAAKTADKNWTKVTSIRQVCVVDVTGS